MSIAADRGWTCWDSAESRAAAARVRADELQQRRAELASGAPTTAETARRARLRAAESLQRARRAHRSAAERHIDAGAAHRRAAAAHDRLVMLAIRDGADCAAAHRDAAEEHRRLAAVHDVAALADAAAAAPLTPMPRS